MESPERREFARHQRGGDAWKFASTRRLVLSRAFSDEGPQTVHADAALTAPKVACASKPVDPPRMDAGPRAASDEAWFLSESIAEQMKTVLPRVPLGRREHFTEARDRVSRTPHLKADGHHLGI